jgi:hypothetical protein
MDDDVFLNPSRLLAAAKQWDKMGAQYVGCMKHGYPWKLPGSRWYEPSHLLVRYTYWLHAYGSVYAIAGLVARWVVLPHSHIRIGMIWCAILLDRSGWRHQGSVFRFGALVLVVHQDRVP